jgi:hypothetical protein
MLCASHASVPKLDQLCKAQRLHLAQLPLDALLLLLAEGRAVLRRLLKRCALVRLTARVDCDIRRACDGHPLWPGRQGAAVAWSRQASLRPLLVASLPLCLGPCFALFPPSPSPRHAPPPNGDRALAAALPCGLRPRPPRMGRSACWVVPAGEDDGRAHEVSLGQSASPRHVGSV